MMTRINEQLDQRNFFSDKQHGFTKEKSTRTAVEQLLKAMKGVKKRKIKYALLLATDFSSAFDRLDWNFVVKAVEMAGLNGSHVEAVRQLLIDRQVQFDTGDQTLNREPNMGCPQGGRASPGLWRLAINEVLKKLTKNHICNVAYADDLAVLLQAKTLKALKKRFKETMQVISGWCERAGLKLSVEKCRVMQR